MPTGSLNIVSVLISVAFGVAALVVQLAIGPRTVAWPWIAGAGLLVAAAARQVNEWERGVLLRLGKFRRVLSPGITFIVPGFDKIVSLVDMRIRSTSFSAEKTLTRDTVPVDVDAVLFWVVTDAKKAILEVETFRTTVSWAAQTTLRDVIGKTELTRMMSEREELDVELQRIIDAKTSEWGVTVQSVEIRDVRIPGGLEDAMSRKAQADREKDARVILASAERLVADEMQRAAEVYGKDPVSLRLRAMNMTYESIKERGALMVVPSGMSESLDSGAFGLAALGFRREEEQE